VVAVLLTAGLQVPVILFVETVGNVKLAPEQIGAIGLKVGIAFGTTEIPMKAIVAHCPASGVNK
jgi:hypothetical protein